MNLFYRIYYKIKQKIQDNKISSLVCLSVCGYYFYKLLTKNRAKNVKLSYFLLALSQNAIEEIVASSGLLLYFRGKGSQKWHKTDASVLSKDRLYKLILKNQNIEVSSIRDSNDFVFPLIISGVITFTMLSYLFSNNQLQNQKKISMLQFRTQIKFSDVIGMQDVKDQLVDIVAFLKSTNVFGSNILNKNQRILIHGKEGTGKTLLAKSIAGEAQCNFIYIQASNFNDYSFNNGVQQIKKIFDFAQSKSPCIVYFNRIEDIGKEILRNRQISYIHQEELKSTIDQFLNEIQNINQRGKIVVIVSTNNLLEAQDKLLGNMQFDKCLKTSLPSQEDLVKIFQCQIQKFQHRFGQEDLKNISLQLQGFNAKDIKQIINESYQISNQSGKKTIDNISLQSALNTYKEYQKDIQN